ncbi:MAG: TonB-dependent receptor [Bacteroidota bacterium]
MKVSLTQTSFCFILCLLFSISVAAQRTVSGTITDELTGEPLIGANILLPATNTGTVTDYNGAYSLEVPEGVTEMVISYTGYSDVTIDLAANPSNVIDLQLSAGELLDEVVVIGYGTVKKEDATGAITAINSEDFNKGLLTSPQELLAGKVAGVQITTGNAPGDGAVIRIRGGSSLKASNDPLIVIDGIPIDNGEISGSRNILNVVNPNDIETFTVLKDASATAIYGSRASNGVILITTKKGSLGKKVQVNYSGSFSVSNPVETVDVLNAAEYRTLINEQFPEGHPARDLLGNSDTDWQEEIYQNPVGQDHSLSFSGGIADILPYRASVGYTNKDGLLKTDNFQRTTVGLNLSPGFMDNTLQVNVNFKGMFIKNRFANRDAIGNAAVFDPTQPIFSGNDNFGGYYAWLDGPTGNPNTLANKNPIALLEQKDDQSDVNRFITNMSIDYRFPFLPELRANLNLGYDVSNGDGTVNIPTIAAFNFNAVNGGGTDNRYEQTRKNELLEFYLNYVKDFGVHRLDVMGGYSWQRNFFDKFERNSDVAGTPAETVVIEDSGELFLLSLFGRVNYTFQDKYLFTFTLRRDGSSRFSPDNRWGLFPAAAFAYKIMENQSGFVNSLKVRVGYGVTGQQEIGNFYQYLPTYTVGLDNANQQFGDGFTQTLRPEEYDANIKWEETTTYNIGLDYSLYNDRIYGSLEYYIRRTEDLLNRIPVPAGTNLSNFIDTNIGDLENRGVEFSVNVIPVQKKDFNWDVGFNITANTNEITNLTATDDPDYQGIQIGGISGGIGNTVQIHSVGFPASSFFLYEQVYDESGAPIEGLYVDSNGDGVIDAGDLQRIENPTPDVFLGLNSTVSWRNFDFSFSARSNLGGYVYNNIQSNNTNFAGLYDATNYLTNVHSDINRIGLENPQFLSDLYLQDGSFFRVDFISVGYNLSDLFNKQNRVNISLTVQNPILISDYSGLDPEIFFTGGVDNREVFTGIDNNIYPRARTFVLGLNANF